MSGNYDRSEEIAELETKLEEWKARNGKLYDGLTFNSYEDLQEVKNRIYQDYISEYHQITNRLEELRPAPPIQKTFSDKHPLLTLLGFALGIVAFFVILNLIVQEEPLPPKLSDSELQQRCLRSIPLDYPQTMYDNAVENCLMIGSND